jgi:type III secretion protein T
MPSYETAQNFIVILGICMARLAPVFQLVPFMGGSLLTALTRNAIIISITFLVYPVAMADAPASLNINFAMGAIIVKEILIGVIMGYLISLTFHLASSVGFIVDNQRGLSQSQATDPLSGEMSSPTGNLVFQTLVMVFIATGGLTLFFGLLLESYAFWPVFSFTPDFHNQALVRMFIRQFDLFMLGVLVLGGPMVIVCFLVDFGMGLMNRFAPQLNVFFLSMPIKSGLSMALMLIYWTVLFRVLKSQLFLQQGLMETLKGMMV